MAAISMKQLLEAGVHFGHQTRRWNPKMKPYIFTERNGIYILDLQKTVKMADVAYNFVREISEDGGILLFVGTKKQAQEAVTTEAKRCGMYYVSNRWLGGLLTNYSTIKKRIDRLKYLDNIEETEEFKLRPKKEIIKLMAQRDKLEKNLGGIKDMPRIPDAVFIVDPKKEHLAIAEARKLKIPIIAIVDTNCDPDEVDYIIPGNDDAIRAVKLISSSMANAMIEGRQGEQFDDDTTEDEKPEPVEKVKEKEVIKEEVSAKAKEEVSAKAKEEAEETEETVDDALAAAQE